MARWHHARMRICFTLSLPIASNGGLLFGVLYQSRGSHKRSFSQTFMASWIGKIMKPITLGIAGGSGAGKTTLAKKVYKALGGEANVVYLTHDHYYRDQSHKPLEERAKTNFDHPDSLETDLLVTHLKDLKAGKQANLPTYDFATHCRTPVTCYVNPKRIIIVEGILVLTHPGLCDEMDIKVFVDADSDTRAVRRITRDRIERGRSLESIMKQYQETVKPMHSQFVEPSKARADVIINSETGHSVDIAVNMITNHLRVMSGLVVEDEEATK